MELTFRIAVVVVVPLLLTLQARKGGAGNKKDE